MSIDISEVYRVIRLLKEDGACAKLLSGGATPEEFVMKSDIRKVIEAVHPYKISPCKTGWTTKVKARKPTRDDGRTTLTSPTKAGLYVKLAEWYGCDLHLENLTLKELYDEWMEYRRNTMVNQNTIQRDEQHYRRYFEGAAFFERKLSTIKRPDIKEFCCSVIRGETLRHSGKNKYVPGTHLTRKEWNNAKSILNGMFSFALDKEYITVNPMTDMKFEKGLFRTPEPKTKDTQVYNTEEKAALIDWCSKKYKETLDMAYLLPILTLHIGTRVGETVALRWDDWVDERHLIISKEEFLDRTTREVTVVPHTKTHRARTIPLSLKAVKILKAIRSSSVGSEWIFSRNGQRLTERQANYVLEKFARETGSPVKSSHKLRKTCGSDLFKNTGLNAKQCADYLGHSEQVFEENYLFDTDTTAEILAKLDQAM